LNNHKCNTLRLPRNPASHAPEYAWVRCESRKQAAT